jgi:hypothetical protein
MVAVGAPFVLLFTVFRNHPITAMLVLYSLMLIVVIVLVGYQNYRSKSRDAEWKRRYQDDEERWAASRANRGGPNNADAKP